MDNSAPFGLGRAGLSGFGAIVVGMTGDPHHESYADRNFDEFDDDLWDDGPPPALMLTAQQRAALGAAIEQGLRRPGGCDNKLSIARKFATTTGLAWPPLQEQLEGNGGYCDCEVLLNVLGDDDVGEPD